MKKILLTSLAALALASCVSDNDLNPAAEEQQYGYINVKVSNDPTVVTRNGTTGTETETGTPTTGTTVEVTEGELEKWNIQAFKQTTDADTYEEEGIDLNTAKFSVAPGTYKVTVEHPAKIENLYQGHGYAHYKGDATGINVTKGNTTPAPINCGPAQNAKIRAEFPKDETIIKDCKIELIHETSNVPDYRSVTLEKDALEAYYMENRELKYQLTYTYVKAPQGTTSNVNTGTHAITLGAKGTERLIQVITNDNGTISVKISYSDFTEDSSPNKFTIDAATGVWVGEGTTPATGGQ